MLIPSEHSPYFFRTMPREDGTHFQYLQQWYCPLVGTGADAALLQFFTDSANACSCYFVDANDTTNKVAFTPTIVQVNSTLWVHSYSPTTQINPFRSLIGGAWYAEIESYDGNELITSEVFEVVSDAYCLRDSQLLKYSNTTNITPYDSLFVLNGTVQEWEWRIPAGIKASGYAAQIDSEDFRNQRQDIIHLYDAAFSKYVLTIGHAKGVPYYYAELLNRVLSCDTVQFYNGSEWLTVRRSGNAVPQLAETFTNSGYFHITQDIEVVRDHITI